MAAEMKKKKQKDFLLFIISLVCCYSMTKATKPVFTCKQNWLYLEQSKKCVLFNVGSMFYNQSLLECQSFDHGLARLATINEFHSADKNLIINTTSDNIQLWTRTVYPNCSYHIIQDRQLQNDTLDDCSIKLPFLCETFSLRSELGMERNFIKSFQISASSYHASPTTDLLEYRPEFGRRNLIFSKSLFHGKGWCSSSLYDEFLEIKFNGTVIVAGLTLQEGFIDPCRVWVSSYMVQYYKNNAFNTVLNNNQTKFHFNLSENHIEWFEKPFTTERVRIKPLTSASDCSQFPKVFCLRLELYGKYFSQYYKLPNIEIKVSNEELDVTTDTWPAGSYAIQVATQNCPKNTRSGYHVTRISNLKHVLQNVSLMTVENEVIRQNMCLHDSNSTQEIFPRGSYCIHKYKHSCPDDFVEGNLMLGESMIESYGSPEKLFIEESFVMNSITPTDAIMFCCRNDTMPNINETTNKKTFNFMESYYLYPLTNSCTVFPNTSSSLEHVTYVVNSSTVPSFDGALYPYVSITQSNMSISIKQSLCYYVPENNADQIVISHKNFTRLTADTNIEIGVYITCDGSQVTSGLDAHNRFHMTLHGIDTAVASWDTYLVKGSSSVTVLASQGGNATITIQMNTTKEGFMLLSKVQVTFVEAYNSLMFVDEEMRNVTLWNTTKYSRNKTLRISYFDSPLDIILQLEKKLKLDEANPDRLHNLIVLEPKNYINTITSFVMAHHVPVSIYITVGSTILLTIDKVRYMSVSSQSNFLAALATINPARGAVIFRQTDTVNFLEYYTLFIEGIPLLKDTILTNERNVKKSVEYLKAHPNCSIFLFLDSAGTSLVLTTAIELGLTSPNNYTWFSFSPKYVISNTFTTSLCQSSKPSCIDAFQTLRNVFYHKSDCSSSPEIQNILMNEITNLTKVIREDFMKIITMDMMEITSQFVTQTRKSMSELSATNFLTYIDAMSCMPSGSGLNFFDVPPRAKNSGFEMMCQPGWIGTTCNIPVCSQYSCNTIHGVCITPEFCRCNSGRFGHNCNGNCQNSCIHGVCNDGRFGDGKCKSCDWLYSGSRCDNAIIYGLVAAVIGTGIVAVFLATFILRLLQTQEQNAEAEIEANESDRTMSWDDLEYVEDIDYSLTVTRKRLRKQLQYTTYKKARTFSGRDVFIKCYERPYFQLSLSIKTELNNLCSLSHNNVEQLVGLIISNPTLGIVTEQARMGSLYDVLHEKHIPIAWDVKYSMMQDICRGMSHLHDVIKIEHGRLKSTNCLVHKGWLVKITDIGLRKLKHERRDRRRTLPFQEESISDDMKRKILSSRRRRTISSIISETADEFDDCDYSSLLWTAPEYLATGVTNLDEVVHITQTADVYGFGIIMAEIISRRPPFSESTVMSIPHIIKAIGHLREPIINLDQVNAATYKSSTIQDLENMRNCLIRPLVEECLYPPDETEKTILRTLMENCWSEKPEGRPPFSYSLEILDLITPLKGSQTLKRAVLLERETESLEQYIGHDVSQILKEKEKYADLLSRVLPPAVAETANQSNFIKAEMHECVTVMISRVANFTYLLAECNPTQVVAVVDYLWRALEMIIQHRKLNITDINIRGDVQVVGSGFPVHVGDRHAHEIATLATRLIAATKTFKLPHAPSLKVLLRIGIFTGSVVSGIVFSSGAPRYIVVGEAITYANIMEKESFPNFVHAPKRTVTLLNNSDFDIMCRTSFKLKVEKQHHKTYWLYEK